MTQNTRWNHPHDPSRSESKCAMSPERARRLKAEWRVIWLRWYAQASYAQRTEWLRTFGHKSPMWDSIYNLPLDTGPQ